jgi:hypothetical protein
MSSANLTGHWIGHYLQGGRSYSITADLVQVEERISGSMRDEHSDKECSLFELTADAGLPPGADEQIEARIRKLMPDAPAGPIRYVSHLPPESTVEGTCSGQTVAFKKTYQGTSFGGYKVGEQLLGYRKSGHCVHYSGRLSSDGLVIDGRWWIDPDPDLASRRTEGLFMLHRSESSDASAEESVAVSVHDIDGK